MANLPEVDQYDAGVYQLETTDPALGGAGGIMNVPPKSLVNRTRYLLNRMLDGILSFVIDSGTSNAIVLSLPQPIAALVDGMEVSFRLANAATTSSTLKLANTGGPTLPALPLYGSDHNALIGGELPAGAAVRAKLNVSLNSGNGAWVVTSVTGGWSRIKTPPTGDTSTLAANMAAIFAASDGLATVNVGVGTDVTLTQTQYGCAILKLTGTPTAPINMLLPANSGQWIIWNQQGGTNNITVKPTGGTGVVLPQGNAASIVCSDGSVASFASAQAGQVSFTPVPITGVTGSTLTVSGGYTPGAVMVEKNGVLLEPSGSSPDFSATTSPTITLTKPAVSSDTFTVYRFTTFNVANAVQKSGDAMVGALALAAGSTTVAPGQGDNSTGIPSTAWVKINGFTYGTFFTQNASTTLNAGMIGAVTEFYGSTTNQTLTLPLSGAAGIRIADTIPVINAASVPVTVARQGTSDVIITASGTVNSVVLQPGDSMIFGAGSGGWIVTGGTAALQFITGAVLGGDPPANDNSAKIPTTRWIANNIQSLVSGCIAAVATAAGFATSGPATNGYIKLPSWLGGLCFQWGSIGLVAQGASLSVTFPISFGSFAMTPVVTAVPTTANTNNYSMGATSTSLSGFYATNNSGTSGSIAGTYLVIGK
jgi:hypothetical protein